MNEQQNKPAEPSRRRWPWVVSTAIVLLLWLAFPLYQETSFSLAQGLPARTTAVLGRTGAICESILVILLFVLVCKASEPRRWWPVAVAAVEVFALWWFFRPASLFFPQWARQLEISDRSAGVAQQNWPTTLGVTAATMVLLLVLGAMSGPRRKWPLVVVVGVGLPLWFLASQFVGWMPYAGWTASFRPRIAVAVVILPLLAFVGGLARHRFQFGVRTLMLMVLVCSLPLSWFAVALHRARRQREAVRAIEQLGGRVTYFKGSFHYPTEESPTPAWLRRLLGDHFVDSVFQLYLTDSELTDTDLVHVRGMTKLWELSLAGTDLTDVGLAHLERLTELRSLHLDGSQVRGPGLVHLAGLKNLSSLSLCGTKIDDAGLVFLEGMTNLERLELNDTQVTPEGVAELRRALPNCAITWEDFTFPQNGEP